MHVKPVFVTAHLGSDFLGTEVKHEVDMHENIMLTKSRIILCFYTEHRPHLSSLVPRPRGRREKWLAPEMLIRG